MIAMVGKVVEGDPYKEYEDISNNLRHYGNLQFSQLTVFILMNAAIINVVFGDNSSSSETTENALKLIGLTLCILFIIMTNRITAHGSAYSKRAVELEKRLGYKQYTNRPSSRILSNRNAVLGVYLLAIVLWISSIILNL
jgi:hypothetical protein